MAESNDEEYEIERILADDVVDGQVFYLVKWKGYSTGECTWEPAENFTSQTSLKEWEAQKAEGLGLDEEFVASVQKRMDDFQSRSRQKSSSPENTPLNITTNIDKATEPPTKKQKKSHDQSIQISAKALVPTMETSRKKGIAIHSKPGNVLRPSIAHVGPSSRPSTKQTARRLSAPNQIDGRAKLARERVGQRFRNLSHMNNYRKKARLEPEPNLSPNRLKSVTEFGIGPEIAHILPPELDRSREEHIDSPLFLPEANGIEILRLPSPAQSDVSIFPPAKVDHRANEQRSASSSVLTEGQKPEPKSDVPLVSRPANNLPAVFPQATIPDSLHIIRANNGRWWYRGDIMCHFTMGQPIGDATMIHITFDPYGREIVKSKEANEPVLRLDFNQAGLKWRDIQELYQRTQLPVRCIGLIAPFDDTKPAFDEFATYLEEHDEAAVWFHPDRSVNHCLLMYSIKAQSWGHIGWRPARNGSPRLHVAVLDKPIVEGSDQLSSIRNQLIVTANVQPVSAEPNDTNLASISSSLQHRPTSPRQRARSASLSADVAGLQIAPITIQTPKSPTNRSDAYRSYPESPASGLLSEAASPITMTPASPQQHQPVTTDPRLKRKYTDPQDNKHGEPVKNSKPAKNSTTSHKLDYKSLISPCFRNKKINSDPRKSQFFISFDESRNNDSKSIQSWLTQFIPPANIYLDSMPHDWVRFRDKASEMASVILFHKDEPNYPKLDGLGSILLTDTPACYSFTFPGSPSEVSDVSSVRVKMLFPRQTCYLITESTITNYLDETAAILQYFDKSKKPGYKILMRPNIEQWLLKYCAEEENETRRGKLIDMVLLIRSLHPSSECTPWHDIHGQSSTSAAVDDAEESYIISPDIPSYPSNMPLSSSLGSSLRTSFSNLSVEQQKRQDDVLRSFFYCFAAVKAGRYRKFIDFIPQAQRAEHKAFLKSQEMNKTLDCGHIVFLTLEKFVHDFCRNDKKDRPK